MKIRRGRGQGDVDIEGIGEFQGDFWIYLKFLKTL